MNNKYETSKIDGKVYCRKNGQFFRHLKSNGFDYKSYYDTYLGEEEYCPYCNRPKSFLKNSMKYAKTCGSPKCTGKETSNTKQGFSAEKWKSQAIKYRQAMNSKSEAELKAIDRKRRITNIEKYGTEHPWASGVIRDKISKTMKERYGSFNFSESIISDNALKLLNDYTWLHNKHINDKMSCLAIAKELNVSDITVKKYLELNNIEVKKHNSSLGQKEIFEYIQSLNINCLENVRDILSSGKEIDIYLPEHKLALEFCGLFWHCDYHSRIDKNYHYHKYKECTDQGIELWTIYEDEWYERKDIIKAKIQYRLNLINDRVYARNTEFSAIDAAQSKAFLEDNHIQGNSRGGYRYGLFENDELVAVMVFKKVSSTEYLLDRFATSKVVVGGFSKMLKNSISDLDDCEKITTFADCRWSQGKLYEDHFDYDKFLKPDYYYIQNCKRYHKFNFRRKHLPKKLKVFDPNLSESDNCRNNNVFKIHDCGKKRYIKHV